METFYLKARMHLVKYHEEDDEVKETKITNIYLENFDKRDLGPLKEVLNEHLLDYIIDKKAFIYKHELRLEDLAEYSHLSFIKSIIPIYIDIEWNFNTCVDLKALMEQEHAIYLYFKIVSDETSLNQVQLNQLMDEISGQLIDGWGEGFEQKELDLSGYLYDEITGGVVYIKDKGYSLSPMSSECRVEIVDTSHLPIV